MNSTSKTSSDWMLVVAGLLVATLIAAVVSPSPDSDASARGDYAAEQAARE